MTVLTEEESSSAKDGSQVQSISASLGSAISLTSNENETVSIKEEEEHESEGEDKKDDTMLQPKITNEKPKVT